MQEFMKLRHVCICPFAFKVLLHNAPMWNGAIKKIQFSLKFSK